MMQPPSPTIGRFKDHAAAERAVFALHAAGFPSAECTVILPAPQHTSDGQTVWGKVKQFFSADPYAEGDSVDEVAGHNINPVAEMDEFTSDYSNSIRGISFIKAPAAVQDVGVCESERQEKVIFVTVQSFGHESQVHTILERHGATLSITEPD